MYVEGAANLVITEQDKERLRQLLATLEEKQRMVDLLSAYLDARQEAVRVVVGLEDAMPHLNNFVLIGTPARVGDEVMGSLAVIGPTRMDYEHTITAVSYIARLFDRLWNEARTRLRGLPWQTRSKTEAGASSWSWITNCRPAKRDDSPQGGPPRTEAVLRPTDWSPNWRRQRPSARRISTVPPAFRRSSRTIASAAAREQQEFREYAWPMRIRSLLPILDSLDRALKTNAASLEDFRSGIELIDKQFHDALAKLGVRAAGGAGRGVRSQPAPGGADGRYR